MYSPVPYEPLSREEACTALEELGWSRRELARRAGIDRANVVHALTPAVPVKVAQAIRAGLAAKQVAEQEQTPA